MQILISLTHSISLSSKSCLLLYGRSDWTRLLSWCSLIVYVVCIYWIIRTNFLSTYILKKDLTDLDTAVAHVRQDCWVIKATMYSAIWDRKCKICLERRRSRIGQVMGNFPEPKYGPIGVCKKWSLICPWPSQTTMYTLCTHVVFISFILP